MSAARRRIDVEEVGDVTVVQFVDKKILDEQNIQMIGDDLFRLVDELGRRKLLLNFSNVEFMSSMASGKILRLHQRLKQVGGKLTLCSIPKDIMQVFQLIRVDRLYDIQKDEETALRMFAGAVLLVGCPLAGCPGRVRLPTDGPLTCPDCRAVVQYRTPIRVPECQVVSVQCPTYEGEWVRGEVVSAARGGCVGWKVAVVGRLDLFASEELERVWATVCEPRRIILDLSAVSELSAAAEEVLARLFDEAERCGVIAPGANDLLSAAHVVHIRVDEGPTWLSGETPVPVPTVPVSLDR